MRKDSFQIPPYGPIPNDWEVQPLGTILEVVMDYRGRTPTKIGMEWEGGDIPALSAKNVCMGRVDLSRETYFGSDALYARWMTAGDPERRDVLITLEAPLGNVAWIPDERKYILSQRVVLLRPKPLIADKGYLAYQLMSEHFQSALLRHSTGTTATGIQRAKLETIPVLIPRLLSEQRRIAAVIDVINEAIAKTEAVIAKLKQVRAGLLHDLLTRGLDEHGQLRDPIAHPEQFQDSPLGRIPLEWEIHPLEGVTDSSAPICYGIVQAMEFVPDGVPVLTIRDLLGDYSTDLHRTARNIDANYARSRVRPDDVLISVKGTIGRVAVVPQHFQGNISRDLARVRPNDRVRAKFLVHLLRSPRGQRILEQAQVGTTRAELSIAPLKRLSFAFPLPTEQERIAMVLDEHDALIRSHEHEFEKLGQLKSGLMTDLLTGRVRVPEGVAAAS